MIDSDIKNEPIQVADEKNGQVAFQDTETQSAESAEEFQNTKPVGKWTRWYRSPLFK